MNDGQFKLNPIVTLNHAYTLPPVGRSLWRKVVKDGARRGVKAKTQYPPRPADWPKDDWPPDVAFALVQADLLRGKSIGFLPTKVHTPTRDEKQQDGWQDVELVIDEWVLLEYACVYLASKPKIYAARHLKRTRGFSPANYGYLTIPPRPLSNLLLRPASLRGRHRTSGRLGEGRHLHAQRLRQPQHRLPAGHVLAGLQPDDAGD